MKKVRRTKKTASMFVQYGNLLGVFFALWFIIMLAWYYVHPVEDALQFEFLKINFFFFSRPSVFSFFSGLVQSYLWGYVAFAVWMLAAKITGFRK